MLQSNAAEVTEPYTFDFINSLSDRPDQFVRAEGINLSNTLSSHLSTYVKQQLVSGTNRDAEDVELVAEDEPLDQNTLAEQKLEEQYSNGVITMVPNLGKTKKDKEKALFNGDLHEHLLAQQNVEVAKIGKKKTSKKFKAKAWREWHQDFIRDSDADQIAMLTQSFAKFRCEDKLALKRPNRFCSNGPSNSGITPSPFGVINDKFGSGHRPPSSSTTYNSCGMPM